MSKKESGKPLKTELFVRLFHCVQHSQNSLILLVKTTKYIIVYVLASEGKLEQLWVSEASCIESVSLLRNTAGYFLLRHASARFAQTERDARLI
jgi:hypothetical protein